MIIRIIKIGNSKGIRIPKLVLEQSGISDEVELEVKDNQITIKPISQSRLNWSRKFNKMAINGDDELLDSDFISSENWDEKEWKW